MLFDSFDFIFFFIFVFCLYWSLGHRAQNIFLLAASYFFYAAWDWKFLGLLILSTSIDYVCALRIAASRVKAVKKQALWFSVFSHLLILGFFKYYGFFLDGLSSLLGWFGLAPSLPAWRVILPWGISFYTFQSMSYTIDVYRGRKPTRNPLEYALFVAFFPQLLAGPIERAAKLLPQIAGNRVLLRENLYAGCHLIFWGIFKKVVIADNLAKSVDGIFGSPHTPSAAAALFAVYGFAIQMFCDFSGYSDIARGLAKCLGFELSENFKRPFLAPSVRDFWKRWHMTMSSWFMDYVYMPLLWNPRVPLKGFLPLLITMTLLGLWHGARWTMVLMGFYFGILVSIEVFFARKAAASGAPSKPASFFYGILQRVMTFHLVCVGMLLFRADSLSQAAVFLQSIFLGFSTSPDALSLGRQILGHAWVLGFVWFLQHRTGTELAVLRLQIVPRAIFYFYLFYAVIFFGVTGGPEYIYLDF